MNDGIYFDLADSDYHALPRLSASGIANMLVSPATYWADSWMNKDREEEEDEERTKEQILGSAYHTARLEPEKFPTLYVRDIDPADHPEALRNGTQIGEQLGALDQTKKKAGESVEDQAARLVAAGYKGEIWSVLRAEFDRTHAGKTMLPPKYYDDIVRDMDRIAGAPDVQKHLIGGMPEVSVLWTDKRTGVKMKARIDYLKAGQFTDFKTFANSMRKPLEQFLSDAFRFNRYYIQAAHYFDATEQIRFGKLKIMDADADSAPAALIEEIRQRADPLDCWYIFQEKNGIPNLVARQIRLFTKPATGHEANAAGTDGEMSEKVAKMTVRNSALHMKARTEIDWSVNMFKFYTEEFGEKPWPPLLQTGEINDENFSTAWLEN